MIGFLRTGISLLFLSLLVWCSFTVPLGSRTLAEHVDRIGETREAKELIRGARGRINPVLEGAKGRLLGEYVEAPTYSQAKQETKKKPKKKQTTSKGAKGQAKATALLPDPEIRRRPNRVPSTSATPRLPGA